MPVLAAHPSETKSTSFIVHRMRIAARRRTISPFCTTQGLPSPPLSPKKGWCTGKWLRFHKTSSLSAIKLLSCLLAHLKSPYLEAVMIDSTPLETSTPSTLERLGSGKRLQEEQEQIKLNLSFLPTTNLSRSVKTRLWCWLVASDATPWLSTKRVIHASRASNFCLSENDVMCADCPSLANFCGRREIYLAWFLY